MRLPWLKKPNGKRRKKDKETKRKQQAEDREAKKKQKKEERKTGNRNDTRNKIKMIRRISTRKAMMVLAGC